MAIEAGDRGAADEARHRHADGHRGGTEAQHPRRRRRRDVDQAVLLRHQPRADVMERRMRMSGRVR